MKVLIGLFVCLVCLGTLLYSQELTGIVRGSIVDQTGLAIPGTSIEVSGPAKMKVNADSGGNYVLALIPGEYVLRFEKDSFATTEKNISVHVGGNYIINITLEVSGVSQTITVEEKAPEIDVGSHTIATTVSSDTNLKLPSGIGYIGLLTVAPGVRVEPVGGGVMSDGSSSAENDFYINGVKTSDTQTGSLRITSNYPFEFMEETQIKRMSDAQYGGSLGSTVNGVLKRGGNDIHGNLWSYATRDAFNASPRPSLRFSPFDDEVVEYFQNKKDHSSVFAPGYLVGGPMVKNKLFFLLGLRPTLGTTERAVTFLRNNLPGIFVSTTRQDFILSKIDADLSLASKPMRLSLAHTYSPLRVRGFLPQRDGTDSPDTLWHERGYRVPSAMVLWSATYFPSDKTIVSAYGGWNYTNFKDTYGLSYGASIDYLTSNIGMQNVPRKLQASSGEFTPNNFQTQKDEFSRQNIYLNISYLSQWKGSHLMDFGYQLDRVRNEAFANTWPDGRFLIAWGARWPGVTRGGSLNGVYGFYIEDQFETSGKVRSSSHSFYFQDKWQIRKNLVFNAGIRAESEYIPSFIENSTKNSKAISFGFTDKIAPRVGFAYDPTSSGKSKISGGLAVTYDVMKYNLPRSAFGGDKWIRCFYPLNDPDVLKIKHGDAKKAFECMNLRVPANDLIDPALKPMQQRMVTLGYERSLGRNFVLSIYGIQKNLIRTVEDVGRLVVRGSITEEQYTITNPGEGRSIDPSWFPSGYPSPITPKAKRDYRAIEIRLDKRAESYFVSGSYTKSELWGNYSGLTSSDERGRLSPNTDRDFDLAHMTRDKNTKLVYGWLATDRPNVLKIFGTKTFFSRLGNIDFGSSFIVQTGTPLSTQVPILTNAPAFAYGRGDMGRTPRFSETGLVYGHEFKLPEFNEHQKIRIEWTVGNLFNQNTVLDKVTGLIHPNDGYIHFNKSADVFKGYNPEALMEKQELRKNPAYAMPSAFQSPRSIRLALRFFF